MSEKLLKLINEYSKDVESILFIFKKEYGDINILRGWKQRIIPQSGSLGNQVRYEFHGVGFWASYLGREIEFDFGPNMRTDGFDLWRLQGYLKSRTDISKDYSEHDLDIDFNNLIKEGKIAEIDNFSQLYFFNDSNNPIKKSIQ